jgi:hypothetical protein
VTTDDEIRWLKDMVKLEDEAGGFPAVTGRAPQPVEIRDGSIVPMTGWRNVERPGYFGKRRDTIIARYNATYGEDGWRLVWIVPGFRGAPSVILNFEQACKVIYEESYVRYLQDRLDDVGFICTFTECIDNSPTNVHSGLDYTAQEASSTHIQDIAMRNALRRLGYWFTGVREELLVIRSADSNGYRFGPGNVPLYRAELIQQPSKCPQWATPGSVEDFWQSNKFLQARA